MPSTATLTITLSIAVLQKLRNHRTIKCIRVALFKDRKTEAKSNVDDRLHIGKEKKTFGEGYTLNWTEKIFTINKVKDTKPPIYKIKVMKYMEHSMNQDYTHS